MVKIFKFENQKAFVFTDGPLSDLTQYLKSFVSSERRLVRQNLVIRIMPSHRPLPSKKWALSFNKVAIKGLLRNRTVFFNEGTIVSFRPGKTLTKVRVWNAKFDTIDARLIQLILGWVGLEQEKQGWIRLHTGGWIDNDGATLVFGSPGMGKSTMTHLAYQRNLKILGDEVLLYRQGVIRAFPLALRVDPLPGQNSFAILDGKPKAFVSITESTEARVLLKRSFALHRSKILFPKIRFIFSTSIGQGLFQMAVYNLRAELIPAWTRIVACRCCAAFSIMFKSKWTPVFRSGPAEESFRTIQINN